MKKRLLWMLVVVLLLIGVYAPQVAAADASNIKVVEWNIVLSDDIGANFYLNVPEDIAKTAVVNATVAGKTNVYTLSEPNAKGLYLVPVRVAAAQMTESITLNLVANGTQYAVGTYSIRDYATAILGSQYSAYTKDLVKHMLNYGAAAQQLFGVNTDKLANADYELDYTAKLPAGYTAPAISGSVDGVKFYGASLIMENRVSVRYYFLADSVEGVSFTVNGNAYKAQAKDDMFYVEVPGILPQNYAEALLLSVEKGSQKMEVSYSPMTYIVRMSQKGSAEMQNLTNALYGYYEAAVSYINRPNATIILPTVMGGTVTANRTSCRIDDMVNLTVTSDEGNCQRLFLNGEPVLLDYATSQYSFVANAEEMKVTGSFVPKATWFWTGDWNMLNQGHHVAHAPAHPAGTEKTGELVRIENACNGVKVLFQDVSHGEQNDFAIVLKMAFADGKNAEARLIDQKYDGKYHIQVFAENILGNWSTLYSLTDAENAAVKDGDGVWYGMYREGTMIYLTINDKIVKEIDVSAKGITAQTVLSQVKVQAFNFGYELDVPYEFQLEENSTVEISLPKVENGTVTADKLKCAIGDTVTLTIKPNENFVQKLYINSQPLLLDYAANANTSSYTYSFVATEEVYRITGSFEPKTSWFWTGDWNLLNQGHNIAHAPAHTDGTQRTGDLVRIKNVYKGAKVLFQDVSHGEQKDLAIVLKLHFEDGQKAEVRLIDRDDNGKYCLQAMGDSFSSWDTLYWLTDAENAAVKDGNGVWYGMYREGAKIYLTINDKIVKEIDVSAKGITEQTVLSEVKIQAYNFAWEMDVPYEFQLAENAKVQIILPKLENGTITSDKAMCGIGDTVTLTITPNENYVQKLYVNNQPLLLDYAANADATSYTYSFVATEEEYRITGTIEPKHAWFWTEGWNLLNEGHNIAHAPAHPAGTEKTGDLVPTKGLYSGASVLFKDVSAGAQKHFAVVLKIHFADGQKAEVRLIDRDDNGKYCLQAMNDSFSGWNTLYWLTEAENAAVVSGDGVWFGMFREDTTLRLRINGTVVKEIDMSAKGITAQTVLTEVKIQAFNFTYEADFPYSFIEPSDDPLEMSDVQTKVTSANSVFYRNDNLSSMADPFILDNTARDGYYYLYGTWGAFRCFRSKNLMDWELRGEVLKTYRESIKGQNAADSYGILGNDMWAPEVVYDPDTKLYYMFFSASPDAAGKAEKGASTEMLMVATCSTPDGNYTVVNFKDANSCGSGNTHTYDTGKYNAYFAKHLFLDPAKYEEFSKKINNGVMRGNDNGGYVASIDAHPFVDPNSGKKYLFWVDSRGADRICGMEMENWLKPKWETAQVLTYHNSYTVADWNNGVNNPVSYENNTTTNEGPFIVERNGKYYLTYSVGNWKYNTYMVAQAVSNSVLGPYTKLTEANGGILLSGQRQGSKESTGTGHHSILTVGQQMFIIYHRHNDPAVGGGARNHAIDEIKWIVVNGNEVMYVNGPTTNLQPRVEKHSTYRNIADEATITTSNSSANTDYLNDGLLSHLKNGHSNVTNVAAETTISKTTTFTFTFEEAKWVRAIMVYNSRKENQIFKEIEQIKVTYLENGNQVTKHINNVPFNTEYYTVNSSGTVTYVQPCAAAYAVFDEKQILSIEITIKVPAGQSSVGISEIRILGKSDGTTSGKKFKSSELGNYKIVYDADMAEYATLANQLKAQISSKYGKTVTVVADTSATSVSRNEILLGDTNRSNALGKVMEYSVTVRDGVFQINVGGPYSADKAINYLCNSVFNGQSLTLGNGEYYKTSYLTNTRAITSGTTARVMTANLWADAFGTDNPASYRAEIFAGMLVAYTPDVVGAQEVDGNWDKILDGYLAKIKNTYGIEYTRGWHIHEGKVNYTSMLYRSDKLKIDNSGIEVFDWWTDKAFNHGYHMRNVGWIQFSYLENTSKKFIVANTHWSYRTEHVGNTLAATNTKIENDTLRTQCKNETNTLMTSLKSKYSTIPIFMTGDFNTTIGYFKGSGNWTAKGYNVISEQAKSNGTALSTVPTSGHYDHLFGTGTYTVKKYEIIDNVNEINTLTDHPFVYADLAF